MTPTPAFEDLLVQDRSPALRSSVAGSPGLDVRVPSCLDWSLHDLVEHLTQVTGSGRRRSWPVPARSHRPWHRPVPRSQPTYWPVRPQPPQELIAALQAAGPAVDCWTW
ncbi:maleylpyruvate isomerase N-terminal domain-containing protein [Streptomyces sp. NBC_01497]|uniref:maleylpyruvate isomerase N-terminal domain-containing protein n=1 Tax=Streptomyces sp. NBC_01497 TaxID=2903885 RepID=UPI003FCC5D47